MFLIKVFQEIGNLDGGKAYADLKGTISQGIVVLGARGDGGLPGEWEPIPPGPLLPAVVRGGSVPVGVREARHRALHQPGPGGGPR
jgi:hypothetical protein